MKKVGKLFKKTPYFVRDTNRIHKDIRYLEDLLKTLVNEKKLDQDNIVYIFSNNRDNTLHFHLVLKDDVHIKHTQLKFKADNIEFTFEHFNDNKNKTNSVNTFLFMETFRQLKEYELVDAFDYMISCDGNKLSLCIEKENLKLFKPNDIQFIHRNTILKKEDFIKDICISFNISYESLFNELNPNLIKQVCKDLNLTYKKLSYELGYKPDTINKAASTGKVSEQLKKAISLYLENLRLKNDLKNLETLKQKINSVLV